MSAHFIESNGCTIHANVSKTSDDAPWLVFSNSLMTDQTIWDDQVAFFAGHYNILRYDQRGHGLSGVKEVVTFDDLSGDVLTLLDHFGIGKVTYVGLSMGVPTGLAFAGRVPDRVSRMILSDGQMATQATGRQTWQARIDAARHHGMPWVADDTVGRWFSPEFVADGGAEQLRQAAARMDVSGYAACAGALQDYDFEAQARGLEIPVLLLAGERDGAMPVVMQDLKAAIEGSEFAIVEDAGHIPNLENAARFNALVQNFLDKS